MADAGKKSWLLYLGTYPPRECGIATFTKDLAAAINSKSYTFLETKICAMNGSSETYLYPKEVIFQVDDSNIQEYIDTAKEINRLEEIKLVNIQHEFGIFGGEYGCYLLPFLEMLNKPTLITFHSVLPKPDPVLRRVVRDIASKVSGIVVITPKGREILRQDYGITTKINIIPHGIPTVPFTDPQSVKLELGYADRYLAVSFGLISSGKGYEQVIESLPKVVAAFPNFLYLILGETHPVVRKNEGEQYRRSLMRKVKELGLHDHVKFYNQYLPLGEIIKYLCACDFYISSGLNPNQISSGTLVYALGCGRPAVSTPFLHALDLLGQERGYLTRYDDPYPFADPILKLLENENLRTEMAKKAYAFTRPMTWNNVALSYLDLFKKQANGSLAQGYSLPTINFSHLERLTDDFGIIQFANQAEPDQSSGYTVDDNSRALITSVMHQQIFKDRSQLAAIKKYLDFISHLQQEDGRFYNLITCQKEVDFSSWSDDAHSRAVWALGYTVCSSSLPKQLRLQAKKLFNKAVAALGSIISPRAQAFLLTGIYYYNLAYPGKENLQQIKKLADSLLSIYQECSSFNWQWFEPYLTYSNSKLPEGLIYAYLALKEQKYLDVAEKTLDFLRSITIEEGIFNSIGQNGWYLKNGQRAYFDQQPIDTSCMVQTLALAYKVTRKNYYLKDCWKVFRWFTGDNILHQMVYDESSGGCHDGLGQFSINLNKGAESTIAYLMARLTMEKVIPPVSGEKKILQEKMLFSPEIAVEEKIDGRRNI